MDLLDDLDRASAAFALLVDTVSDDQWSAPTPCDAWTVRDLVDHVTGGNRFAVALLDGLGFPEALGVALAPGFGEDAAGELRASAEAQAAAFGAPGALDRVCHHPTGDIPGAAFAGYRLGDVVVHTWDLARALGADETLDGHLVEAAWAVYETRADRLAASGMFGTGPVGAVPDGAPLQTRLLDLVGRQP